MPRKTVRPTQAAIDRLPLDSGTYSVEGCPGLYLRCLKTAKSYYLQRRVHKKLVKVTIGIRPIREARREAARLFSQMAPRPSGSTTATFRDALEDYLTRDRLSARTRQLYRGAARNCLSGIMDWRLSDLGADRFGIRALQREIADRHGKAQCNMAMSLLSGVYRWARKADPLLPENPTTAIEQYKIPARDWALSNDELRSLRTNLSRQSIVVRAWWTVALLTGGRSASISALSWTDVDFDAGVLHFQRDVKRGRAYSVPMSDVLINFLKSYGAEAPPSQWVFPSPQREGDHLKRPAQGAKGMQPPHRLRHTFRTTMTALGAPEEASKLLLGHSLAGASGGYVTTSLLIEPLRRWVDKVAGHYSEVLGGF